MHDHDPDDAEMRAWLAGGKAPAGICPHCGSRISVVQRDAYFIARCSHRGCGASGPKMRSLSRAVETFVRYVVHPSHLTNVVDVLEDDLATLTRERDELAATFQRAHGVHHSWVAKVDTLTRERDEARAKALREAVAECKAEQDAALQAANGAGERAARRCADRIRALAKGRE